MRLHHALVIAAALVLPTPVSAKTYAVPKSDPLATVFIPDNWDVEETDDGAEATSPDEGVYLAIEGMEAKDVEAGMKEAIAYQLEQGVTLDKASLQKKEMKINDMDAIDLTWKGSDEKGPVSVSVTLLIPSAGNLLMVTYRGSPASEQKVADDLLKIIGSLQATKK